MVNLEIAGTSKKEDIVEALEALGFEVKVVTVDGQANCLLVSNSRFVAHLGTVQSYERYQLGENLLDALFEVLKPYIIEHLEVQRKQVAYAQNQEKLRAFFNNNPSNK